MITSLIGNAALTMAFTFMAPLPFLPVPTTLGIINFSMAVVGLGMAFTNVSSFTRAQQATQRLGFEQDLKTYIMISGT